MKLTIVLEKSFSDFLLLHNATDSLNRGNSISTNINLPGVSSVNSYLCSFYIDSKFCTCLGIVQRNLRNACHTLIQAFCDHIGLLSPNLFPNLAGWKEKKKILRIRISVHCSDSRGLITVSSSVAVFVYDSFFASIIGTWWYACHFYGKQEETLKTIYIKLRFFRW